MTRIYDSILLWDYVRRDYDPKIMHYTQNWLGESAIQSTAWIKGFAPLMITER